MHGWQRGRICGPPPMQTRVPALVPPPAPASLAQRVSSSAAWVHAASPGAKEDSAARRPSACCKLMPPSLVRCPHMTEIACCRSKGSSAVRSAQGSAVDVDGGISFHGASLDTNQSRDDSCLTHQFGCIMTMIRNDARTCGHMVTRRSDTPREFDRRSHIALATDTDSACASSKYVRSGEA